MKNIFAALMPISWSSNASSLSHVSPYVNKIGPVTVAVEFKDLGLANLHIGISDIPSYL